MNPVAEKPPGSLTCCVRRPGTTDTAHCGRLPEGESQCANKNGFPEGLRGWARVRSNLEKDPPVNRFKRSRFPRDPERVALGSRGPAPPNESTKGPTWLKPSPAANASASNLVLSAKSRR